MLLSHASHVTDAESPRAELSALPPATHRRAPNGPGPVAAAGASGASAEAARRVVNVLLAALALVALAPLMMLIALAVKLGSRGPVIYVQERVGLDRRRRAGGAAATTGDDRPALRAAVHAPAHAPAHATTHAPAHAATYAATHVASRLRYRRRATVPASHHAEPHAREAWPREEQRREDVGGAPYRMYKFRTMRVDAESDGRPVWAAREDPRVTRVGRLLRRTRLDELPQLVNVLRGEMNLVGPRPERPAIAVRLRDEVDGYALRYRVRPGITGWAQVNHPYDATLDDVRTKVRYDLEYMERVGQRGVAEDLRILALTVPVMLGRRHGW
jgi:lipopolysaccharide/colanic/teichoic acid biosynthesis glycosyltransferase